MMKFLATWKRKLGFPRNDAWVPAPVDPEVFLQMYEDYSTAISEELDAHGNPLDTRGAARMGRALSRAEARLASRGIRHPKINQYVMRLLAANQVLAEGDPEKFRFGGFVRAEDGIDDRHCGVKVSFVRALAVARMAFIEEDDIPRYDLADLLQKAQGFESGREAAA